MIFIFIVLAGGWKVIKRTKFQRGHEVDLTSVSPNLFSLAPPVRSCLCFLKKGLEAIEAYTQAYEQEQSTRKRGVGTRIADAIF